MFECVMLFSCNFLNAIWNIDIALEHGLTGPQLVRLQEQGLTNMSKLAFALTTPGTVSHR